MDNWIRHGWRHGSWPISAARGDGHFAGNHLNGVDNWELTKSPMGLRVDRDRLPTSCRDACCRRLDLETTHGTRSPTNKHLHSHLWSRDAAVAWRDGIGLFTFNPKSSSRPLSVCEHPSSPYSARQWSQEVANMYTPRPKLWMRMRRYYHAHILFQVVSKMF